MRFALSDDSPAAEFAEQIGQIGFGVMFGDENAAVVEQIRLCAAEITQNGQIIVLIRRIVINNIPTIFVFAARVIVGGKAYDFGIFVGNLQKIEILFD